MANAIYCYNNSTEDINFSGQTIPQGSFIIATDAVPDPTVINYCFEITDNVSGSGSYTATSQTYSSCYECLVNNYTTVTLELCTDNSISEQVDISAFDEIPIINTSYFVKLSDVDGFTYIGCFGIREITQYSLNDYTALNLFSVEFLSTASFPDCEICLNGFSAGIESQSCQICWDGSGYTASVVSVPHPSYTNISSQTIIQFDAITLGGFNGLNN